MKLWRGEFVKHVALTTLQFRQSRGRKYAPGVEDAIEGLAQRGLSARKMLVWSNENRRYERRIEAVDQLEQFLKTFEVAA